MPRKRIPCSTTRCFNPKIHPKRQAFDMASLRLQIRKHPRATWEAVIHGLRTHDWATTFRNPRHTSIREDTLVCTARYWVPIEGKGWLNLDDGKVYRVRKRGI